MEATLSKLKVYSIGIIAKNKPLDTNQIEVTPTEDLPMLNGEITDVGGEVTSSGNNRDGSSYSSSVNSSNTIKATWMPIGSANRYTSPDVRRGEYVMIYQFGDADKYYWVTFKDDLKLRKLETVIYAFSGTQKETDGVSAETHYFLEISTHKKLLHLHTSKANGEPFAYDIQINTDKGYILIQDDNGNFFCFDSKERRIELKNTDTTHLDIDKKNFTLTVPDNTVIDTGKNTTINTGKDTLIKTGGNTTIKTGGDTLIDSGGNTTIKSAGSTNISSGAGNTTITSSGPTTTNCKQNIINGNVKINGNFEATKISTGSEIDCPSISGVASGLK